VGVLAYNNAVFFLVDRHMLIFLLGFCIFRIFRRTGAAVVGAGEKEQGRSQQTKITIHRIPPFFQKYKQITQKKDSTYLVEP
jgi:hypothetical protein